MFAAIVVALAAAAASALTFYSGFGLGTLLMPVFALFLPVETAVASTAAVHAANNVFKTAAVGRLADWAVVLRFGVPALCAAYAGALALGRLSRFEELAGYSLGPLRASITPVKLALGALMTGFAVFELVPACKRLRFDRKYLPLGGLLSGFFGGLSGHQGALRSAFLVKVGIDAKAFVGSNAVIGLLVDCVRLATYAGLLVSAQAAIPIEAEQWPLPASGIAGALAGVMLAGKYLHKATSAAVQSLVGALLLLIAALLTAGIL